MINPDGESDVLLCFCHNGSVAFCFMETVVGCFMEDVRLNALPGGRRRLVGYQGSPGPYIHENRTRAAQYFLEETDHQWLWFVDNDMRFPVDTLYRLLDAANEYQTYILGAAYWNTFGPVARGLSWVQFTKDGLSVINDLPRDATTGEVIKQPLELSATGMGCTLIHRDVIEALTTRYVNDPWPTFAPDILTICKDGTVLGGRTPQEIEETGGEHLESGVTYSSRVGEDLTFCFRARQSGFKTYGLATVMADHFKPQWVTGGESKCLTG